MQKCMGAKPKSTADAKIDWLQSTISYSAFFIARNETKRPHEMRTFGFARAYTKQNDKPRRGDICEADAFCEYQEDCNQAAP